MINDTTSTTSPVTNEAPTPVSVSFIRLADGTFINPATREPVSSPLDDVVSPKVKSKHRSNKKDKNEYKPTKISPIELEITPQTRRSIMDLALQPQQMAFVNNVLVLTLWGMPDDEIAMCCGCESPDIHKVRGLDEYNAMQEALTVGLYAAVNNTVQGKLNVAAITASDRVIESLNDKKNDIRLKAGRDILDRTGHRPVDRVEHIHSFGDSAELTIRVVKDSDKDNIPTIDVTPAKQQHG